MGTNPPEPVTIEADAVSVTKSIDTDRFPVDAVAYSIESTESVEVQLTDTIPETLPIESVGFHPEFGEEHWEATSSNEIQFTYDMDSEESIETVFGVRESDIDLATLLTEPDVTAQPAVNGSLEPDVDEDVEQHTSPEPSPAAANTDGGAVSPDENGEPAEPAAPEPSASATATSQSNQDEKTDTDSSIETAAALLEQLENGDIDIDGEDRLLAGSPTNDDTDQSVLEQLLTELDSDDVDSSLKDDLRNEIEQSDSRSVEIRIERLQSTVADLDAYTDALEEFLDENGTGQELLQSLDDRLTTAHDDIAALEEGLDTVEATVDDTTAELAETTDRVDELEQRLGSDLDDVGDEIETLQDDISDLREFQQTVEAAFAPSSGDD